MVPRDGILQPPALPPEAPPGVRSLAPVAALFAMLHLPFLGQAFHIDDPNFLTLARGALADPLRPQDVVINWLGTPERAFDVLSNPPGVAWLLALAGQLGPAPYAQHLAILPFTALAAWGGIALSRQLCRGDALPGLLLMAAPALVVSAHTVMPDLPLLGCLLAGLALFVRGVEAGALRPLLLGALIGGAAALFRYSGLLFVPIALLYGLLGARRRPDLLPFIGALALATLPSALLALQGALVYGMPHIVHMVAFQRGEAGDPHKGLFQLVAQISFLGGTAALPLLPAMRRWAPLAASGLGAALALLLAHTPEEAALLALTLGSGAALLASALTQARGGDRRARFLVAWLLLALAFNQALRFASVRYLLPGLPALLMLWGPQLRGLHRPIALGGAALLALALSVGDTLQAGAYRAGAAAIPWGMAPDAGVYFAGHWGLQGELEARGAQAIDAEGPPLPAGAWVIAASLPWPQDLPEGTPDLTPLEGIALESPWPLRTLSATPPACFYANATAAGDLTGDPLGQEAQISLLPYALGVGAFDTLWRYRVGGDAAPAQTPGSP